MPSSNGPYKVSVGHKSTSVITDAGRIYTWGYVGPNSNNLGHTSSHASYNGLVPNAASDKYVKVSHSMAGGTGRAEQSNDEETYAVALTSSGKGEERTTA